MSGESRRPPPLNVGEKAETEREASSIGRQRVSMLSTFGGGSKSVESPVPLSDAPSSRRGSTDDTSDLSDESDAESRVPDRGDDETSPLASAPGSPSPTKSLAPSEASALRDEPSQSKPKKSGKQRKRTDTKEYWLEEMNKKDLEIAAVEHELQMCEEKRKHLHDEVQEENRRRAMGQFEFEDDDAEEETTQAIISRILAENTKKARQNCPEDLLDREPNELPNPESYDAVQQVQTKRGQFLPALSATLGRQKRQIKAERQTVQDKFKEGWKRWVAQVSKREEETQAEMEEIERFFIEQVFPVELRSKRGRATRVGRDDEAVQEALKESLRGADAAMARMHHDPALDSFRGHTVPLPEQLTHTEKKVDMPVIDHNRIVADSMRDKQELDHLNVWTEAEKETFLKRFLMYPKKFEKIAHGLPNKTRAECVLYYYRSKKKMKYKQHRDAQRKIRQKRRLRQTTQAKSGAPKDSTKQQQQQAAQPASGPAQTAVGKAETAAAKPASVKQEPVDDVSKSDQNGQAAASTTVQPVSGSSEQTTKVDASSLKLAIKSEQSDLTAPSSAPRQAAKLHSEPISAVVKSEPSESQVRKDDSSAAPSQKKQQQSPRKQQQQAPKKVAVAKPMSKPSDSAARFSIEAASQEDLSAAAAILSMQKAISSPSLSVPPLNDDDPPSADAASERPKSAPGPSKRPPPAESTDDTAKGDEQASKRPKLDTEASSNAPAPQS